MNVAGCSRGFFQPSKPVTFAASWRGPGLTARKIGLAFDLG